MFGIPRSKKQDFLDTKFLMILFCGYEVYVMLNIHKL